MKKKCDIFLFLYFAVILISLIISRKISSSKNLDIWLGEYRYKELAPHSENGTNYHIYYQITVWKQDEEYYAIIQDEEYYGIMQDEEWFTEKMSKAWSFASLSGDENKINITFLQTLAWDDLYGVRQRYEKGEVLLQLERIDQEIITEWGALRERSPELKKREDKIAGRYFEKETLGRGE